MALRQSRGRAQALNAARLLLVVSAGGCAPVIRLPAPEARVAPAPVAANPGKVLLVAVGAICALLVLVLILEGPDMSLGN